MPRDHYQEGDQFAAPHDGDLPRRRRSQSVATAQPSVETVVVKAKRAASTLWTLLHAQNCVLADVCSHQGCREAKLLNLHLKTCPAGEGFPCPVGHRGCDQARKLLGHYRRCRKTRARQAGQLPSRRDPNQQHTCLVCSLVARQARSLLDKKPSSFSSSLESSAAPSTSLCRPTSSSTNMKKSSTSLTRSSVSPTPVKKASGRRIVASFMLDVDNVVMPSPAIPAESKMPPPPPRALAASQNQAPGPETKVGDSMGPPQRLKPHASLPMGSSGTNNLATLYRQGEVAPVAHIRPRSASVGDTTLLFKSSSAPDLAGCDTIEEEPVTNNNGRLDSSTRLFNFDGLPYNKY